MSSSFLLCALVTLQEGIGLPGSLFTAQEQISQGEGIIQGVASRLELACGVWILHLNDPSCPACLDREPASLTRIPVLVANDTAMRDQIRELRERVALNSSKMSGGPVRRALAKLYLLHGKLRKGGDSDSVKPVPPSKTD